MQLLESKIISTAFISLMHHWLRMLNLGNDEEKREKKVVQTKKGMKNLISNILKNHLIEN